MKNFFIYASLVALSSPFLPISAVVPTQDTSLTNDELNNKLTSKIQETLTQLANLPNNLRTTRPWQTLAWSVVNYTASNRVFKSDPVLEILPPGAPPREEYGPLRDLGYSGEMLYVFNDYFKQKKLEKFKGNLLNAINHTVAIWGPSSPQASSIDSLLQKVRETIVELEKNQSQIPIIKDNNIRDSQGMRICKEFFQQGFKANDVNNYSQTYQVIPQDNRNNPNYQNKDLMIVNKAEIQKNTYESLNQSTDNIATPINKLKRNILHLVLFVKESMPYKDWVTGVDKLPDIQKAGTNIVAFTPEIIDYLKRAYAALERIRSNDPIVRTLVCNEIRKICQAAGLSSPV